MLLFSPFNFLFGNLRQAVANPVGKRSVIDPARTFPQRTFFLVVRQRVSRFADSFFSHVSMVYTLIQYCTDSYPVYTMRRTRMAFIAGCQQSEISGSPDFTRPSICDCLERVFLRTEVNE